jgi:hypothetical protein
MKFGHRQVLGADATDKRVACVCGVVRIVGAAALKRRRLHIVRLQKPTTDQREASRRIHYRQMLLFDFRFFEKNPMTKIEHCGQIILIRFDDGGIAEIVVNSTAKPISADELVQLLLAHDVTAAKIVRTQTAQESPPPRFET